MQRIDEFKESDVASALKERDYKDSTDLIVEAPIAYGLDRASYNQGQNAKPDFSIDEELIAAQTARGPGAVAVPMEQRYIVRRLTPLEEERLQGFPDGWTGIGEWVDDKGKVRKPADAPRYKALGNSIALPFWQYLARRICAQYERDITMGSLFDGVSGFPYVFTRCGAKPIWSSEIEPFCVAVAKEHFGDDETGKTGDIYEILQRINQEKNV